MKNTSLTHVPTAHAPISRRGFFKVAGAAALTGLVANQTIRLLNEDTTTHLKPDPTSSIVNEATQGDSIDHWQENINLSNGEILHLLVVAGVCYKKDHAYYISKKYTEFLDKSLDFDKKLPESILIMNSVTILLKIVMENLLTPLGWSATNQGVESPKNYLLFSILALTIAPFFEELLFRTMPIVMAEGNPDSNTDEKEISTHVYGYYAAIIFGYIHSAGKVNNIPLGSILNGLNWNHLTRQQLKDCDNHPEWRVLISNSVIAHMANNLFVVVGSPT